jgi:hypothetical protein
MSIPLDNVKTAFGKAAIPDHDAEEFIEYYQTSGVVHPYSKSLWLDDQVFKDIYGSSIANVDGIRLYYAKYKKGVGQVDKPGGPAHDHYTVILALTQDGGTDPSTGIKLHHDIPGYYYDYGQPCKPTCNGGLNY